MRSSEVGVTSRGFSWYFCVLTKVALWHHSEIDFFLSERNKALSSSLKFSSWLVLLYQSLQVDICPRILMKAKFQNSKAQHHTVWKHVCLSRHEHACGPQARKNSTMCAMGPGEPKVATWKDPKYVKTKMQGGVCVLKRDYFCLLVSACPILVFNLSHSFN